MSQIFDVAIRLPSLEPLYILHQATLPQQVDRDKKERFKLKVVFGKRKVEEAIFLIVALTEFGQALFGQWRQ